MPQESEEGAYLMHVTIKCGQRVAMVTPPDLQIEVGPASGQGILIAKCPACGHTHRFYSWEFK